MRRHHGGGSNEEELSRLSWSLPGLSRELSWLSWELSRLSWRALWAPPGSLGGETGRWWTKPGKTLGLFYDLGRGNRLPVAKTMQKP